jgi:hypothetical protein
MGFAYGDGEREILLIFDHLPSVGNRSSVIEPPKSKDSIPTGPSPQIESILVHKPLGPFL